MNNFLKYSRKYTKTLVKIDNTIYLLPLKECLYNPSILFRQFDKYMSIHKYIAIKQFIPMYPP